MKKKGFAAICVAVVMLISCMTFFTGCDYETPVNTTPKEYTIQYTDDSGTHTITVTDGMPYSLDVVPEKTGYDFLGLYDAEVGGTQYVSASGSSLAPFTDKKNMVLFPQYKAKDYTVILDYQGAAVTGSRKITVAYGSSLPELPKNLTGDHKEFAGWYTEAECGGTQIADQYGLIPLVSVLNEQNFDLSTSSITLYAGFEMEKHTVTFCFEVGMDTEDMQIAYDTPINQVVPKTRVNGEAVLTWSKTQGGEVWNGKVTSDMVLYAVEYAPVIEFDSNGGKDITPIVARAGSTIALPTPTKDLAKFSHWEDMSGNSYTSTTMPTKSTTLKAVWQAKLVFDENGGTDVNDISVAAGNKITLPIPEREGFIFAGWYTPDREQYTSTIMPVAGIKLKAGWYRAKKETKIYVASDKYLSVEGPSDPNSQMIDMKKIDSNLDYSGDLNISLEIHFKSDHYVSGMGYSGYTNLNYGIYTENKRSDSTLLYKKVFEHNNIKGYQTRDVKVNITVRDGVFFIIYDKGTYSAFRGVDISDYYITFTYPDTSNLYL